MDEGIHSIEKLLFALLKRHTAFNGQFSIGVHRRFRGREFAPSGDKPPPADTPYAIGLLNALILRAADFVPDYKVSRLFHRRPGYRSRHRHLRSVFAKNRSEVRKLRDYSKSDYAINKYSPNIVYRFHDEMIEVSLEDYLKENLDKTEQDFAELKTLSDEIYYEQGRAESAQTCKDVSIHGLEEMDCCSTRPLEEELDELAAEVQNRRYARIALERLFATGVLTEVQKRRFRLHVFRGLSIQQIGRLEGTSHRAVAKSLNFAIEKLKKFFAEQG